MIEVEGLTKRYGDKIAVDELTDASRSTTVRVRTPGAGRLRQLLAGDDAAVSSQTPDVLEVRGLPARTSAGGRAQPESCSSSWYPSRCRSRRRSWN